jgi:spore germination protein YaaH
MTAKKPMKYPWLSWTGIWKFIISILKPPEENILLRSPQMYQKLLICSSLLIICAVARSQVPESERKGIHQTESEYYSTIIKDAPAPDDKGSAFPSTLHKKGSGALTRMVLGWHPYWAASSAHLNYDYDALSHIAYFSYEVDTATGGYSTIRGWNTTSIIDYAHQRGTKVLLTVTNFGSARNTELLSDTIKQIHLLNTLIPLLISRNGDGVNFDLETVSVSQRNNLVDFMQRAVTMIKAELPDAEISMATPAVDWSGSWDLKKLSEICDYLIVMGYNYYYGGSSTAGPVAPLAGENYNITRTVNTYLTAEVAPEKLLLGLPWYGYDWPVTGASRKSSTTGTGTSRVYSAAETLATQYSKTFDELTSSAWVSYTSASLWRQLWYDDSESLIMKYDFADSKNLAGIGIWALSYEGTHNEIWSGIHNVYSPEEAEETTIIRIFPNPVYGTAEIEFSLFDREQVTLKILDINGRERINLVDEERDAGFYTEEFNSATLKGGIYICTLRTKNKISSRKIVIIK